VAAPDAVRRLVERFAGNAAGYRSPLYNETQVRVEFIDPFFSALGWDMANLGGVGEQFKDVVHEDKLRVEGGAKAPDYSFRIGGVRKFFLEAKRPSVNVEIDPLPALQVRRYAWSAKLPVSVLTDFDGLAIYGRSGSGTHASTATSRASSASTVIGRCSRRRCTAGSSAACARPASPTSRCMSFATPPATSSVARPATSS
jgi:predicted type IV restriction endonuclease